MAEVVKAAGMATRLAVLESAFPLGETLGYERPELV
jgi:hypothetical protein